MRKRQPPFFTSLAALLALLATTVPAHAQSQAAGGALEGTISDESGGVLPGVNVTIRNLATGVVREVQTDAAGRFRGPLLPVGPYEVSAALQGFSTLRRTGLTLTIGQTLVVDLSLKVASAQEEITVTAEATVIDPARSHQASTVGERAVSNLPVNGRNFIDFVLTTPGVTRDQTRGGDISFAGMRGTLNSLVIDGADNNNTFFGQTLGRTGSGRAPYQFSQDAVQEFQVNRNAYSAEYGRAGGAVINVVTKSGTNELHGSVFEFYRDKSLNANSWINKTASPLRVRSPFRINQFGASLGGPLVKDKAFFFLSYDGQRRNLPNDVTLVLPSNLPTDADTTAGLSTLRAKAGSWQQTQDQNVLLAKVDYQLNAKHRVTLRYNHQNFTGGNNESSGPQVALEHSGDSLVQTRTLNASLSSVLSPTYYNELRVQYARDKEPGLANTADPEALVNQAGQRVLTIGRNFFSPRETTINRVQVADTVTVVRGSHTLKFGADLNRDEITNFFPGNFSGSYTFSSIANYNRGIVASYVQAFAGQGTTGPTTHPDITEFGTFFQDEWKLRKSMVLTFGLRYDLQAFAQPDVRNPDPQLAAAGIDTSFLKTDKNNVAPRLGLAWNPNPKTVLRAGYGLFYGRTPSIMVGTAHSNNGINVQTVTFGTTNAPVYPQIFTALPTGANLPKPTIFVFDKDYESPEVHQASAGVEYALSKDIAVGASYLFVAGRKLQRSRDFNVGTPVPTEIPIQGGGTLTVQQFPLTRPFTNFDRIIRFESTAEATYNGLTLEIKKRFTGKLQASLAYTLSKVTDTVPDATAVVPGGSDDAKFASNPADFEADRAPGVNDQRHRLVLSGYWDLAYFKTASTPVKVFLDGWSFSWIATASSGQPYSQQLASNVDLNRDGNGRNDIVPGSRNQFRLPANYVVDARLSRRIPLGSRVKLEVIGEAFNLLNSTNIATSPTTRGQRDVFYNFTGGVLVPQQNLSNPRLNFGADQAALDARIVQIAAKVTF